MKKLNIVIVSAMEEEVGSISENLIKKKFFNFGDLSITQGLWEYNSELGIELNIFLAFSGWGKVSSSRAISRILGIQRLSEKIDFVIFTGVAGAASNDLKQWDVIISESIIQYDMDASPLFDKFVIPALNNAKLIPNNKLFDYIFKSLSNAKEKGVLNHFGKIKSGLIGTGDRFISNKDDLERIKLLLP